MTRWETGGHTLGHLTACQSPGDPPRPAQQAVGAWQCVHEPDATSYLRSTLPAGCWRALRSKLCNRLNKATAPGRCWRKAWRKQARWCSCWPCAALLRKAPAGAPGARPCSGLGDHSMCHTGGTPRRHQPSLLTSGVTRGQARAWLIRATASRQRATSTWSTRTRGAARAADSSGARRPRMSAAAEEAALAVVGEVLASHAGRRLFPVAGCQVHTAHPLLLEVRHGRVCQSVPICHELCT